MPARIFLAPLDWGLGHATRLVPVIRALLAAGVEVELGASGAGIAFLKQEFPELPLHRLPEYGITYTANGMKGWHLLLQTPRVMRVMREEHRLLTRLIRERNYSAIISDNRFGIRNDNVPSICITHQVNLQTPPGFGAAASFNRRMLNRFSEVWIPDTPNADNLSGELAHGLLRLKIPHCYIGLLSRFSLAETRKPQHLLALISGPEPQRTIFERKLVAQLKQLNRLAILVRGLPGANEEPIIDRNITVYNHLPSQELQVMLENAQCVISRSGYSTLSDAAVAQVKLIAVPAPGQTEQEYLGHYLAGQDRIVVQAQNEINLEEALRRVEEIPALEVRPSSDLLQPAIQRLLNQLNRL